MVIGQEGAGKPGASAGEGTEARRGDPLLDTLTNADWVPPEARAAYAREREEAIREGRAPPSLAHVLLREGLASEERIVESLPATSGSSLDLELREAALGELAPTGAMLAHYRVEREIGRGGMGVIYEAHDTRLNRRVALKVMRSSDSRVDLLERFHREGSLAARLVHASIISVHEIGVALLGDRLLHYIAMDLVDGRDLAVIMDELSLQERIAVLQQVARGVGHAHERGVVHRDLKPGNVLIDGSGRAIVTDFGLARSCNDELSLTQTGTVLGTAPYMSPEQVEGDSGAVGPRSDVWALGVMLYEMLTGTLPFAGHSAPQVFRSIAEDEPAPPRRRVPGVPADLEAICLHALEKHPDRRYASANELAEDLERWQRGEPVRARPPSRFYRLKQGIARRRAVLSGAALALLASLAIGLTLLDRAMHASQASAALKELLVPLGDRIQAMLEPAEICLRQLEADHARGDIDLDRSTLRRPDLVGDALGRELVERLGIWQGFAWISVSTPGGDFCGAYRKPGDERPRLAKSYLEDGATVDRRYVLASDVLQLDPSEAKPEGFAYDPRTRPFYEAACASDGTVYTPPYVFWRGFPGITCARAVRQGGEVVAVLTVDFEIWQLSRELERAVQMREKETAPTALCVLTPRSELVAHSSPQLSESISATSRGLDEDARLLTLQDLDQPIVRSMLAAIPGGVSELLARESPIPRRFHHEGEPYWVMARPCSIPGLDLVALATISSRAVDARRPMAAELHYAIVLSWALAAIAFVLLPVCCLDGVRSPVR